MNSLEIKLASVIAHLAEYLQEWHSADITTAMGLLSDVEVTEALSKMKSSGLLPASRSRKSIAEMLEARQR